ncbi:unnamed protein product [Rangifer tarandus platyrhynchus]|uniref:Transmembrane protein n=1 Tax=Rangifer tarandus platyrhynchus TaxID=3082113 RepID=A0ABN8XIG0_RANTA|nr:unnamed protein product [Rangifer tarandus platyrhynchus]
MQLTWRQLLLIAGGTAATAACLYYLLREDGADSKEAEGETKKLNAKDASKEQVVTILRSILKTQEKTKALMKDFIQDMVEEDLPDGAEIIESDAEGDDVRTLRFEEAYERVAAKNLEDPLEQYGLTMPDFDGLLDKYQHDPQIKDLIMRIMSSSASLEPSVQAQHLSKAKIIEVHEFMRQELQKLVEHVQRSSNRAKFDVKNVTLTAQAYVGARVQKRFGLTSEEVESAVFFNHKELAVDADFVRINMGIQAIMNQLIVPHCVM